LKEQLSERIEALLPHCEEVVGRNASAIRIKAMKSRWGSCNTKTGTVSIALRLVHFDPRCLEMVLYHELCHLIEPNHGPRFHALMDVFCPDWRDRNKLLGGR
jgi:predicted metal-dependent hydrolase